MRPAYAPEMRSSRDEAFLRLAIRVFAALIFLRLCISDPLLNQFYPYSDEGGIIPMKIHPATYGMLALLLVMLFRLKFSLNTMEVRLVKPMFYMIGVIVFLVVLMAVLGRSVSIGYLLETYIAACLIGFMMFLFPPGMRRVIGDTILIYITINAGLAIAEKVLGQRIYPYPYNELSFRPTALTSHPLIIGLINTGAIVFFLATRWPAWLKGCCMGLVAMGTFAAGARTGMIFASASALFALVFTRMPGGDFAHRARWKAILLTSLTLSVPILIALAGAAGFLERFSGGYIDENAQARIDVYKVFEWVSWGDILFGKDILVITNMVMDRLGILVETSVVIFIFQFGLFGALLFTGTLLYMLLRLAAGADWRAYIAVGAFMTVALSNPTLSSKHCYILMMLLLLIAYRRDVPDAAGRFHPHRWGQAHA